MNEIVEAEAMEVVPYRPAPTTLFGTEDPAEVVARASASADALVKIVRDPKRGLISNISGKEYPKVEAWTLLGSMLGVFPVCIWTRKLEDGWEARVEAHTRDGAVVGAAEAECLRAERNWKSRDDFALRSMAQTRATSKALRLPLGFVMALAGIEATPAEEMTPDTPAPAKAAPPKAENGAQAAEHLKRQREAHALHRALTDAAIASGGTDPDKAAKAAADFETQFRSGIKALYGTEHINELGEEQLASLVVQLRNAKRQVKT